MSEALDLQKQFGFKSEEIALLKKVKTNHSKLGNFDIQKFYDELKLSEISDKPEELLGAEDKLLLSIYNKIKSMNSSNITDFEKSNDLFSVIDKLLSGESLSADDKKKLSKYDKLSEKYYDSMSNDLGDVKDFYSVIVNGQPKELLGMVIDKQPQNTFDIYVNNTVSIIKRIAKPTDNVDVKSLSQMILLAQIFKDYYGKISDEITQLNELKSKINAIQDPEKKEKYLAAKKTQLDKLASLESKLSTYKDSVFMDVSKLLDSLNDENVKLYNVKSDLYVKLSRFSYFTHKKQPDISSLDEMNNRVMDGIKDQTHPKLVISEETIKLQSENRNKLVGLVYDRIFKKYGNRNNSGLEDKISIVAQTALLDKFYDEFSSKKLTDKELNEKLDSNGLYEKLFDIVCEKDPNINNLVKSQTLPENVQKESKENDGMREITDLISLFSTSNQTKSIIDNLDSGENIVDDLYLENILYSKILFYFDLPKKAEFIKLIKNSNGVDPIVSILDGLSAKKISIEDAKYQLLNIPVIKLVKDIKSGDPEEQKIEKFISYLGDKSKEIEYDNGTLYDYLNRLKYEYSVDKNDVEGVTKKLKDGINNRIEQAYNDEINKEDKKILSDIIFDEIKNLQKSTIEKDFFTELRNNLKKRLKGIKINKGDNADDKLDSILGLDGSKSGNLAFIEFVLKNKIKLEKSIIRSNLEKSVNNKLEEEGKSNKSLVSASLTIIDEEIGSKKSFSLNENTESLIYNEHIKNKFVDHLNSIKTEENKNIIESYVKRIKNRENILFVISNFNSVFDQKFNYASKESLSEDIKYIVTKISLDLNYKNYFKTYFDLKTQEEALNIIFSNDKIRESFYDGIISDYYENVVKVEEPSKYAKWLLGRMSSSTLLNQGFDSNLGKQQEPLPSKIEYIDGYKARNPFYDKEKNDKSEETIEGKNKIDLNKKIILKYFESSGYKINQIVGNLDDITFKDKLGINLNQDLTKQDFENITMSFGRLFISKIETQIEKYSKGDPIRKILEETKKKLIINPVEGFKVFLEFVGKNEDVVYKLGLYEGGSFVEKKLSIDMMEDYIGIREYYDHKQKELVF